MNCDKIVNWMNSNQFKLNAGKTHLMTVGISERLASLELKVEVTMDGVRLENSQEKSEFLLGCELQPNLKWSSQVEMLLKNLRSMLVALTTIRYIVPFHIHDTITIGIFNSVLVYCLPLFERL